MGKRIFLLIIVLMSIALIGIIFVQVFWIKNTILITEEQFTSNVKFALAKVRKILDKESLMIFMKNMQRVIKKVN